jgi:hypothetical protein
MPTAALKVTESTDLDALVREALKIEIKIAPDRARMEEIKSELKKRAKDRGEGFKHDIEGLGIVKVAAPREGEFKGTFPVPKIKEIIAATSKKDKKEIARWVDWVATWGSPFYGSVTVEPY